MQKGAHVISMEQDADMTHRMLTMKQYDLNYSIAMHLGINSL